MSVIIIDSSVALAWCFEDEVDPYSDSVLESLQTAEALVPAIWPFEIANVFLVAERRGRVTAERTRELTGLLNRLPISIEEAAPWILWDPVVALARERGLSAYGAAYLELAARLGVPLASRDETMRAAATDSGVGLFRPLELDGTD